MVRSAMARSTMAGVGLLLVACAVPPPAGRVLVEPTPVVKEQLKLQAITYAQLPYWKADQVSEAIPAFLRSCVKIKLKNPNQAMGHSKKMGMISDWIPLCDTATLIKPGNEPEARFFFEKYFQPYEMKAPIRIAGRVKGYKSTGLVTGYYEPQLRGAWRPDSIFRYPLYSLPNDIKTANLGLFREKYKGTVVAGRFVGNTFVPYMSRADIDQKKALKGRQLEILWVDDPVDAFFLHIQGSGRIAMRDGSMVRVGYAGRNGREYRSIGRELINAGIYRKEDVSMQTIRQWIKAFPYQGRELMFKNESYIFFGCSRAMAPLGHKAS